MTYDLALIKDRLTLRFLMERDGHRLVTRGGRTKLLCPVHEERTPSCSVEESNGTWYCHGCGKGGDIFTYWQETRGGDFKTAASALAEILGGAAVEDEGEYVRRLAAREVIVEPIEPLAGKDLERWREGLAFLCKNEEEQARIAEWRGLGIETVKELAEAGKLGLPLYFGNRREGFAVEALCPVHKVVLLAGYHVRIPPETGRTKAEWRFVQATGTGAWPFVLGDIATAKALLVFEGQWDAIAMCDAGRFGACPKGTALIGIRGATGWRKLLAYSWPASSQAFLFADADAAGATWFEEEGFAAQMRERCKVVHAFKPRGEGIKDFNDLHKIEGRDSAVFWRGWLRRKFIAGQKKRQRRKAKKTKKTKNKPDA